MGFSRARLRSLWIRTAAIAKRVAQTLSLIHIFDLTGAAEAKALLAAH